MEITGANLYYVGQIRRNIVDTETVIAPASYGSVGFQCTRVICGSGHLLCLTKIARCGHLSVIGSPTHYRPVGFECADIRAASVQLNYGGETGRFLECSD